MKNKIATVAICDPFNLVLNKTAGQFSLKKNNISKNSTKKFFRKIQLSSSSNKISEYPTIVNIKIKQGDTLHYHNKPNKATHNKDKDYSDTNIATSRLRYGPNCQITDT